MAHLQRGRPRSESRRHCARGLALARRRPAGTVGSEDLAPTKDETRLRVSFSVLSPTTERLDRFLADQLAISRTQAARLVADRLVAVNDTTARASRTLQRGDSVRVDVPDAAPPREITPLDFPLAVVYEDEHLLVLDKPAGLVVHPAPGHWGDTLVNALVARGMMAGPGGVERSGIVHRLDRDTSGLLVVARTDRAHRRLGAALAAHRIRRRYAALAWGHFDRSPVVIEAAIGRHPADRKRMVALGVQQGMEVKKGQEGRRRVGGRPARTDVEVVARFPVVDLLRLSLHTGRTHQIRVHLEQAGHPVVGDPVYHGGGARRISGAARQQADRLERMTPRQALHAAELAFRHPIDQRPLRFRSEWPADLRGALDAAAWPDLIAGSQPLTYLGFFTDPDA